MPVWKPAPNPRPFSLVPDDGEALEDYTEPERPPPKPAAVPLPTLRPAPPTRPKQTQPEVKITAVNSTAVKSTAEEIPRPAVEIPEPAANSTTWVAHPDHLYEAVLPAIGETAAQLIFLQLYRLAWGYRNERPGRVKITHGQLGDLHKLSKKTVQVAAAHLVRLGYVRRHDRGMRDVPDYEVLVPPAEIKKGPAVKSTAVKFTDHKEIKKNNNKKGSGCAKCGGEGHYFTDPADASTFTICRH